MLILQCQPQDRWQKQSSLNLLWMTTISVNILYSMPDRGQSLLHRSNSIHSAIANNQFNNQTKLKVSHVHCSCAIKDNELTYIQWLSLSSLEQKSKVRTIQTRLLSVLLVSYHYSYLVTNWNAMKLVPMQVL